jgi:predicted ATP-binding protein involved in virulence
MRIRRISVAKLFGRFDYNIPLNKEGITIIHGPNGYGKTTLLRIVHSLLSRDYDLLYNSPFKELRIDFCNGFALSSGKQVSCSPDGAPFPGSALINETGIDTCYKCLGGEARFQERELLRSIINGWFLYKQLDIENGKLALYTEGGDELSPKHLSSGEGRMLGLFSFLLLSSAPGLLVLLDCPEASLHVAWQRKFLKNLQKVIALRGHNILISTHSPSIIDDRWDLTVGLGGNHDKD